MITGFEEFTTELNEIEVKKIAPFVRSGLLNHVGKENIITGKEICRAVKEKLDYNLITPRLRKVIYYLQVSGQVKCLCATSRGYFVAKNEQELKENLKSLYDRIQSQTFKYQSVLEQFKEKYRNHG